jgi:hypothetical protein
VYAKALFLNTASAKSCTMAYYTLFSGLGVHYPNTGIYHSRSQFIKECFVLVFKLTPDGYASDGHNNLPDNGKIRIELKFDEALVQAMTILLYQELDASMQIDRLKNVSTVF